MVAQKVMEMLHQAAPTLSAGVLSADLSCLQKELEALQAAGVKTLHFDVMDGHFCPALTLGAPFIQALKTPLLKDVHLMIEEPLPWLADYAAAGADLITVHVEATRHPYRALQEIGKLQNANDPARGILRGVALNPGTPLDMLEPLLDETDMLVLLAVNPGWGGQKFISSTFARMSKAREMIATAGRDILLCVDGGITAENIAAVAQAGADLIVAGSAVFAGGRPQENARALLAACRRSP